MGFGASMRESRMRGYRSSASQSRRKERAQRELIFSSTYMLHAVRTGRFVCSELLRVTEFVNVLAFGVYV